MKSFVITIQSEKRSVQVADRCIRSGKKYGIEIEKFNAITPIDNPFIIAEQEGIDASGFQEIYSRLPNCLSAFLSHYFLWKKTVEINEPILILEHDAVIVDNIPIFKPFQHILNLGKPSYGKSISPMKLGVNPLTSKQYFPGAHAYIIKPSGAKYLIEAAKISARPTDIFLHKDRFPWLEEYYPWPVEARDSFTTIQSEIGCKAKHNYGETYEII